ncbi:hypothetical protein FRC19_007264 [Serendipita sp. 401]|nr:hypothetical protein FRC18_011240 [Serendipita sp. 400]KAG8821784.1 hypothetical protein FRC19_007264 [Serendipita sp. 401]
MRSRTWGLTSSAPTPSTKAARPPRSLWAHSASVYIRSITDNLFPVERSSAFPQSRNPRDTNFSLYFNLEIGLNPGGPCKRQTTQAVSQIFRFITAYR